MNVLHQRPCRQTPTLEFDPFAQLEMNWSQADSLPWHPRSFANHNAPQHDQRWPIHGGGNATSSMDHDPGWPYDNDWSGPSLSAASILSEISPEFIDNMMPAHQPLFDGAHPQADRAHCQPQPDDDDWPDFTPWEEEAKPRHHTPKPLGLPSLAACSTQTQEPHNQLDEWLDFTWAASPLGDAAAAAASVAGSSPGAAAATQSTRRLASPAQLDQVPRDTAWTTPFRQEAHSVPWAPTPDWSLSWRATPMPLDGETPSWSPAASTPHASVRRTPSSDAADDDEHEHERQSTQARHTTTPPQGRTTGPWKARATARRPLAGGLMERNRAAATSSRLRQREMEEDLVAEMNGAKELNRELHASIRELTSEVLSLKMEVLQHARCNSKLIYRYINRTAEQHLQSL